MLAVCDCERLTGGCEARLVPIWTMARSSSMCVPARGAVDGSEQMLCHLVEIAAGDEVGNEVRRVWRLVLDPWDLILYHQLILVASVYMA